MLCRSHLSVVTGWGGIYHYRGAGRGSRNIHSTLIQLCILARVMARYGIVCQRVVVSYLISCNVYGCEFEFDTFIHPYHGPFRR